MGGRVVTCRPHYGAERAATTPIIKVIVRGVEITSRYRKRRELALMARVISAVPKHEVGNLAIWCDSKCTHSYAVNLRPGWRKTRRGHYPQVVADAIGALLCALDDGHNGISVYEAGEHLADADCWWDEP